MGNIHQLRTDADARARLLERWITETIARHPNHAVAARWTELARETARRYPGAPLPSKHEINLDVLENISAADRQLILAELQSFMLSYFDDVNRQLMDVHTDLLSLQKRVAELELGL